MRDVVLYATDTMADWEYSYLTAGLAMAVDAQPGRWRLRVLADAQEQVTTAGGLRLLADGDLDEAVAGDVALLVLPGANTWHEGHERALALASTLVERGVPVAGICGATFGLARAGVLDGRPHTSNAPEFLVASGYAGAAHYVEARVVDHEGLVTAPATAPVDFAAALFRRLGLFSNPVVDAWYGLYTSGERRYYDDLIAASAG